MASNHFTVKNHKKTTANGKNCHCVSLAAYRRRTKMNYEIWENGKKIKRYKDYSNRKDLVESYFIKPDYIKIKSARDFWQFFHDKTLELNIKRNDKNAVICREWEIGLHNELSIEDNKKIISRLIQEILPEDTIADVAIHFPEKSQNLHAHILFTDRHFDKNGNFGKKQTIWGKKNFFSDVRKAFERISNEYLPEDAKISMASYQAQIDLAEENNLKATADELREKKNKRRNKVPVTQFKKNPPSLKENIERNLTKDHKYGTNEKLTEKCNSYYYGLSNNLDPLSAKFKRNAAMDDTISSTIRDERYRNRESFEYDEGQDRLHSDNRENEQNAQSHKISSRNTNSITTRADRETTNQSNERLSNFFRGEREREEEDRRVKREDNEIKKESRSGGVVSLYKTTGNAIAGTTGYKQRDNGIIDPIGEATREEWKRRLEQNFHSNKVKDEIREEKFELIKEKIKEYEADYMPMSIGDSDFPIEINSLFNKNLEYYEAKDIEKVIEEEFNFDKPKLESEFKADLEKLVNKVTNRLKNIFKETRSKVEESIKKTFKIISPNDQDKVETIKDYLIFRRFRMKDDKDSYMSYKGIFRADEENHQIVVVNEHQYPSEILKNFDYDFAKEARIRFSLNEKKKKEKTRDFSHYGFGFRR